MDILEQYKKEHPKTFKPTATQPVTDPYGREYGAMVRLAMGLSGGRLRTVQQANYALLAFAGVVLLVSLFFFFRSGGPALPSSQEILRDTPTKGLRPGAQITP